MRPAATRGFMLLELLVVVGLLAVFAAVAVPVLRGSVSAMAATPPAVAAGRLDAAVKMLRGDVWGATTLAAPSPHELRLTAADGRTVTWQVGPGDRLHRDGQRWTGLFPEAAVDVDGAAVRLSLADARGFHGGVVVLPSEALLLKEGAR